MMHVPLRLGRHVAMAAVLALGLGLALPFAGARATDTAAEAVIEDLAEGLWAALHDDSLDGTARLDRMVEVIEARTDVALLARLALGRHWSSLSAEQQARYQELFDDVVIRNLARRLGGYARDAKGTLDEHFQVLASQPVGKSDVLVRSKVTPVNGPPLALDWRLRERDGGPVIIDLIVEGVSLLVSQRSEFAAVIERSDMNGLLAELEARARAPTSS
jgi:phospholipid transport system substrate-binding protein